MSTRADTGVRPGGRDRIQSRSMSQLFQRKPIAALVEDTQGEHSLKRSLGAGDLIMLAIGAVIGAGIFGAIGTAAAGQIGPNGEVIRQGAGPALVFSFLLLGGACALAGPGLVGVAFDSSGVLVVASNETAYRLPPARSA